MFSKFFRRLHYRHIFSLSLAVVILILSLGVFLYWQNFKNAEKGAILATQQRSLVLVRAGALAINEFLISREGELALLAQSKEVASLAEKEVARKKLEIVVDKLTDTPLSNALRVDREGKVVLVVSSERITQGEGSDVSDRDYFLWAQKKENQGKFFLSKPFFPRGGAHPEEMVFVMVTPTYFNGQFTGLLLFSFRAPMFAEKYVLPLLIYEKTRVSLITKEGVLIGGEPEELLGKSLPDYSRERKWPGWEDYLVNLTKATEKEGVGEWFFVAPDEPKPKKIITAFTPVDIGETRIVLLVTSPAEATSNLFFDLSQSQNLVLVLLTLSLVALILWDLSIHLARRDGFFDGAKNGYQKGLVDGENKKKN